MATRRAVMLLVGWLTLSGFHCGFGHRGDVDEECNADGTCNGPNLECIHPSYISYCFPKARP